MKYRARIAAMYRLATLALGVVTALIVATLFVWTVKVVLFIR